MSSALTLYLRALDGVSDVVASVPDERWDDRSPCPDWSARRLLGHVVDAQRQVVAMLAGDGPRPPVTDLAELARIAGPDPARTWLDTRRTTADELSRIDPDTPVPTPLGTRTAADVLAMAVVEPLVHAWDLATATDRPVALDAEAVEWILPAVLAMGSQLAGTGMYQPAVPLPADAPPQDQLLAALGRARR